MSDEYIIQTSQCCGAEMPDYPDRDVCPSCGEHTGVEITVDNQDEV